MTFLNTKPRVALQIAGATAIFGVFFGLIMAGTLGDIIFSELSFPGFITAALVGAGIAGFLVSPALGRKGWIGAGLAFVGCFTATVLGAYLAGIISLPVSKWGYPMMAVFVLLFSRFGILWGMGLILLHVGAQKIRAMNRTLTVADSS